MTTLVLLGRASLETKQFVKGVDDGVEDIAGDPLTDPA